ncbi:MAG: TraB/GumN family protein [Lysobacteraceae bacterium]
MSLRVTSFARAFAPLLAFSLVLASGMAGAQDAPPQDGMPQDGTPSTETAVPAGTQDLDAIVVTGRQPGPGLWKVSKGDHVLWILGVEGPLPKRMEWDSANVERRIAASQEVLAAPSAALDADVGFFRGLTLLPSLLRVRKNPDGKLLRDLVPPAQYARWEVLKARYIGSDQDVEAWRPLFAALQLYRKAIDRVGLTEDPVVTDAVRKAARRSGVPITDPKVTVRVADPKNALKSFAGESLDDTACFAKTLERIDVDLGAMVERANAWAQGDTETLRAKQGPSQWRACGDAITSNAVARRLGLADIEARVQASWMAAAEKALDRNASTFATLPTRQLFSADGYLAKLAARGYAIEEP